MQTYILPRSKTKLHIYLYIIGPKDELEPYTARQRTLQFLSVISEVLALLSPFPRGEGCTQVIQRRKIATRMDIIASE